MNEPVKLRALTIADAQLTWQWRNQRPVKEFYSDHPFEVSLDDELKWYKQFVEGASTTRVFGVEAAGILVGMTLLKNIHPIHKVAEFAIIIDESAAGIGYGTVACRLTLNMAFDELKLHRVFLKVRTDHTPAIRLYEKCGFVKEGTLREEYFKNGHFHDQFVMGILQNEYHN